MNLQELFYKKLLESHGFHNWVRKIHARINRIPYVPIQGHHQHSSEYVPTMFHKVNAFRVLFQREFARSVGFRR
ncbi:uncharacterized protein CANTADRAFT_51078 [Suhomyces tanzawaensis NRRL Y-17324]|uniref:Uncharacterized protein n=1 Tax=Suhomyces tanzawaensis NRRL Y-17324 TaxID=984487 RepID=A0A1E4SH96_9ASCO|nr:uncharacterized protein CANTADRAFT_51078 [Suhomyces tanzawaensis NRRL Y-17324]ODV78878.1 hypothetical protein CANTADRAFT_51078 [Suhomyces tanzawaensis NRRL Y-17324]